VEVGVSGCPHTRLQVGVSMKVDSEVATKGVERERMWGRRIESIRGWMSEKPEGDEETRSANPLVLPTSNPVWILQHQVKTGRIADAMAAGPFRSSRLDMRRQPDLTEQLFFVPP
jgi:hypothetical protein